MKWKLIFKMPFTMPSNTTDASDKSNRTDASFVQRRKEHMVCMWHTSKKTPEFFSPRPTNPPDAARIPGNSDSTATTLFRKHGLHAERKDSDSNRNSKILTEKRFTICSKQSWVRNTNFFGHCHNTIIFCLSSLTFTSQARVLVDIWYCFLAYRVCNS